MTTKKTQAPAWVQEPRLLSSDVLLALQSERAILMRLAINRVKKAKGMKLDEQLGLLGLVGDLIEELSKAREKKAAKEELEDALGTLDSLTRDMQGAIEDAKQAIEDE